MQAVSDVPSIPPPPVAAPAGDHADMLHAARRGVLLGLATLTVLLAPAIPMPDSGAGASHTPAPGAALTTPVPPPPGPARFADFGPQAPSAQARHVADWVADSRDNGGAHFIVLDKQQATLYVFDAEARLRGATPVLLGAARGDDTVPGIGARAIADVQPHERTTPAGRFVAERGRNTLGEDVVWVDYDAAVSIHRLRETEPKERRLQRLASKTIADNRVSYGCINVPVAFYETYIRQSGAARTAIVYVLPEQRTVQQVFGSYDVAARHGAVRAFQANASTADASRTRRAADQALSASFAARPL